MRLRRCRVSLDDIYHDFRISKNWFHFSMILSFWAIKQFFFFIFDFSIKYSFDRKKIKPLSNLPIFQFFLKFQINIFEGRGRWIRIYELGGGGFLGELMYILLSGFRP
jgi:hypothetical protein